MARTIQSPGVEIKERDLSLVASLPIGTNIFVQGFADQGPTDELINVTSISEFEQIFGTPNTASERYFYHTARRVLDSPGNLLATRLPYGDGVGEGYSNYSALLYPVVGLSGGISGVEVDYTEADYYKIQEPVHIQMTSEEYMKWDSGQIDWQNAMTATSATELSAMSLTEVGGYGIIIVNEAQTSIDELHQGYYVAMTDNRNLGDVEYDSVQFVKNRNMSAETVGDSVWNTINEDRLEFSLTGTDLGDASMSEIIESVPSFNAFNDAEYADSLVLQVYKLRKTLYGSSSTMTIDMIPVESYLGSLDATRQMPNQNGGISSFYIAHDINENSNYIKMFVNPNIASNTGAWGTPPKKVRTEDEVNGSFGLGSVIATSSSNRKHIGNLPEKLERSLRLAENRELIPIDIVTDGGLSTVWSALDVNKYYYDDTAYLAGVNDGETGSLGDQTTGSSSLAQSDWQTIFNAFQQFAGQTRRDCLFIADPLRQIFVQGNDQKILDDKTKNFSQHVYWPLKNLLSSANSNYSCVYANWVKRYDNDLGDYIWLPFAGYQANIFANLDSNLQPWFAGAGLNNGIVRDIVDISIKPTQKQRDLLYKINANPIAFFPGDGYAVWGQKTLQKKPSAFDRINVRRLFLVLEKATLAIMRYFVFEPNTVFTRSRVVNVLSPIFDIAKNNEGVYDYLIVCDERNNTPNVIDNNELVVDIYIKPVRIGEYILCNFIATRTDQDFTELL